MTKSVKFLVLLLVMILPIAGALLIGPISFGAELSKSSIVDKVELDHTTLYQGEMTSIKVSFSDKENQKILRDIIRCGRHEVLQQGIQNGHTGKHDNKDGNNRCQNQGTHLSKCQHAKEDDGDKQNQYAKIHIPFSFPL